MIIYNTAKILFFEFFFLFIEFCEKTLFNLQEVHEIIMKQSFARFLAFKNNENKQRDLVIG